MRCDKKTLIQKLKKKKNLNKEKAKKINMVNMKIIE
jgi:hypothetical protein